MTHRFKRYAACAIALLALPYTGWSYQYKNLSINGFVAQGYLYSKGNNYFGDSTDGSTDYYEAGVNGSIRIRPDLMLSGQWLARDAGNTDNGSVRTDYLLLDYRMVEMPTSGFGLRLGRVKNEYGLYNSTRDVVFTRPTVLLPESVYFEGAGVRELLFSSDGLQLYGYWDHDLHSTSLTATFGRDNELSDDTFNNLFGSSLPGEAELRNPIIARLLHEVNGGQWRLGLSVLDTDIIFSPATGSPLPPINISAQSIVLSLQRNLEQLSLTSEYRLMDLDGVFGSFGEFSNRGEGAYLQAEYRLQMPLTLVTRYDLTYGDRERPNQTDSHDLMLGLRWEPTEHLVLAADLHGIRGTSGIPRLDNSLMPALKERTELFVLMLGLRF